jgi:hypothetical protein
VQGRGHEIDTNDTLLDDKQLTLKENVNFNATENTQSTVNMLDAPKKPNPEPVVKPKPNLSPSRLRHPPAHLTCHHIHRYRFNKLPSPWQLVKIGVVGTSIDSGVNELAYN